MADDSRAARGPSGMGPIDYTDGYVQQQCSIVDVVVGYDNTGPGGFLKSLLQGRSLAHSLTD
jgi:hypothetical protein